MFFLVLPILLFCFTGFTKAEIVFPDYNHKYVTDVLKKVLPKNPVIIDAGAYNGDDSVAFSKLWPQGKIYAFEPVPSMYPVVVRNTKNIHNIYCFPLALSDHNGTATFFLSSAGQGDVGASSLLQPKECLNYYPHIKFDKKTEVATMTLDSWAQANQVDHVDLLWFDLQGAELMVLKAAPKIVRTAKVVYVEVEFVEIYAQQGLFLEVDDWLKKEGFTRVARDFDLPLPKDRCAGNCLYVKNDLLKQFREIF